MHEYQCQMKQPDCAEEVVVINQPQKTYGVLLHRTAQQQCCLLPGDSAPHADVVTARKESQDRQLAPHTAWQRAAATQQTPADESQTPARFQGFHHHSTGQASAN